MKVILLQNVKGIGQKGQVVEVKDGFARNNLIPRRLAQAATGGAVKQVQDQKAKSVEKLENMKESAEAVKTKVDGKSIELTEKVADSGKLYAAVSTKEVAAAIKNQLKADVPVKAIDMDEHIKEAGEFTVNLKLFKGVTASLTLHVKAA